MLHKWTRLFVILIRICKIDEYAYIISIIIRSQMSNRNTFESISVADWSNILPTSTFESVDHVEVSSGPNIVTTTFHNLEKEKKIKTSQIEVIESLVKSDILYKYIVIGRNDEYHELGQSSIRPFGTIREAFAYGKTLTLKEPYSGQGLYHSFVIQPLLKDENSFELTSEHIEIIWNSE